MARQLLTGPAGYPAPAPWADPAQQLDSRGAGIGRRLARLPGAWLRHRRIRAELLALDDDQLRDAGIPKAAVSQAIHEPFRLSLRG